MVKKIFKCLMICLVLSLMVGCSNEGGVTGLGSSKLTKDDLSIEDFVWETSAAYVNGEKLYAATLTNNSDYDVIGVEIHYSVKDDASKDELKVFDSFMEKHKEWFDDGESNVDVVLIGIGEKLVKKGEMIDSIPLFVGMDSSYWSDLPTREQMDVMQPEELQLGIIGKDNVLYIAYYNFIEEQWLLDTMTKDLSVWPENELSSIVQKPESEYCLLTSDVEDDDISFYVFDATKDMFDTYVSNMKEKGFTVDPLEYDHYYSADDENENDLSIRYDENNATMYVSVFQK